MARMKPQMTPEQQTAYRQAVAQKVIDSIPYEKYCAITPEQAAKQIKAWEKSKAVDFSKASTTHGRSQGREQNAPEQTATSKAPERQGRPKPQMTPEQQTAYRQAVAQKVIDSIPYEKYCAITPEQAAKQIKAWEKSQAVDFNQPPSNRRNAPAPERAAPAKAPEAPSGDGLRTRHQLNEFVRLVKDGRLNPISRDKWATISSKEMGKLIYIGQQREKNSELAPARDQQDQEKEPEARASRKTDTPEKQTTSPRNRAPRPRSRGNDLDM